jgi:hypothetical protein
VVCIQVSRSEAHSSACHRFICNLFYLLSFPLFRITNNDYREHVSFILFRRTSFNVGNDAIKIGSHYS